MQHLASTTKVHSFNIDARKRGSQQRCQMAMLAVLLLCLALASGLGWANPAAAPRTILNLTNTALPIELLDWGDYKIETGAQRAPQDIASSGESGWQPTSAKRTYSLTTGQFLWVRFTLPPAPDMERWFLEIPDATVNHVSLFTLDSSDQWQEQKAGNAVAVNDWPVPNRYPLMPLVVSAEQPQKYLLRIENPHNYSAPLRFVSEKYLIRDGQNISLLMGIYFGPAAFAMLLATISAVSLRDRSYALFALSIALITLTQASLSGITGLHLWPQWPIWNNISTLALSVLTLAVLLWFSSAVVSMRQRSRRIHYFLTALGGLGVVGAACMVLLAPPNRLHLLTTYFGVSVLSGLVAMLWAKRHGDLYAKWLLLGFTPLVIASAIPLAQVYGLIETGFLAVYSTLIGAAIQLPIILIVLTMRSHHRRENTRRIAGLDRLDPATGLINEHVFSVRLTRMIARSELLKHQSAVMLIDVVNSEVVQRDFGRRAADELPLRVAERLLSTAREIDSAARLSEHRFAMLVEGPFSAEEAATLGPRIVARCLMPYKGLNADCIAQVRVAYALVPQQGTNARALLDRLDERLASEPADSRRAVFVLGEMLPLRPRRRKAAAAEIPTS